jgi:hypothetical protein
MSFLTRLVLVLLLIAVGGGVLFLATWDMPSPSQVIEKPIPADRVGG